MTMVAPENKQEIILKQDQVDTNMQQQKVDAKLEQQQQESKTKNLEEDEKPFYSVEEQKRIIINYDKNRAAAEMYKLDSKNLTKQFSAEQIEAWVKAIPELESIQAVREDSEVAELLDGYLAKCQEMLNGDGNNSSEPLASDKKLKGLRKS